MANMIDSVGRRRLAALGCAAWGVLTLAYVAVRAIRLSFVHDESLTYIYAAHPNVPLFDVIGYDVSVPANNHLLNSLLMRLSIGLLGTNEFTLRLPNVIAYFFFALCSFLIVRRFRLPFTSFGLFVLLTANPFVLDFFGLARGYGLAMGFLMISILFLGKYFEKEDTRFRNRFLPFFFAALSVLANFTLLHFYVALFATFILAEGWLTVSTPGHRLGFFVRQTWPGLLVTAVLLLSVLPILSQLRATGALEEVGGTGGFFSDTVVSLARNTLYSETPVPLSERVLPYGFVLLFFCSLAAAIWFIYRNRFVISRSTLSIPLLVTLVTLLAAVSSVLQHYLFNVHFLSGRIATFLLPLFVTSLGVLFDEQRFLLSGVLAILVAAALINFESHANISYALDWKYDADTKKFMDDLVQFHDRQVGVDSTLLSRRMNLGTNWLFEPTVNFYIVNKDLRWLNIVQRTVLTRDYDYYFYMSEDKPSLATRPIHQVKTYPLTGNTFSYR